MPESSGKIIRRNAGHHSLSLGHVQLKHLQHFGSNTALLIKQPEAIHEVIPIQMYDLDLRHLTFSHSSARK